MHARVRARFGPAADAYVTSVSHASGEDLERVVEVARASLGELPGLRALDVATGGGHTARVLAAAGADVTASDLTPAMLVAAEAHLRERVPSARVRFVPAAAEALPFDDASFNLVTCRIAAHHFHDPGAFVAEARRVLEPGGVLVVVDNIAPEAVDLAQVMNHVERMRDASHVEAYPVSRWVAWLAGEGLEPVALERFWRVKELAAWLERGGTEAGVRERILAYVAALPARARAYLGADAAHAGSVPGGTGRGGGGSAAGVPARLRHEVMLLAAERR